MIKVLHSLYSWLPQSMTWLYEELSAMPQNQIEHQVVCDLAQHTDQFPIPNIDAYNYQSIPWQWTNRLLLKAGLRKHNTLLETKLATGDYAALHSHFGDYAWKNIALANWYKVPHIVTFYGYDVNRIPRHSQLWKARYAELFASVALVTCEGPFMASEIMKLGCPPEKIQVQRLGVNLHKIHFRSRSFHKGDTFQVLIAGVFRQKKGIVYALEAVAKLRTYYPDIHVTIVGDAAGMPSEQEEKNRILAVVEKHQLQDIITFKGMIPHAAMLALAYDQHVFLSPSVHADDGDSEGGAPVAIIEMAASGLPIISTTHCDIPFVLSAGNASLLSAEKDVDGLVQQMKRLIDNPVLFQELANANRQFIEEHLDVYNCSMSLLDRYKQVI